MAEKTPFRLTDRAGPYVAGQRIKAGQETVSLTEVEAAYELREGTISREAAAPLGEPLQVPATDDVMPPSKRRRRVAEGGLTGEDA